MRLLAIDDLLIDDESFYERPMVTDRSNRLEWSTRRRQGVAGSVFFGGQSEPAKWNILFKCNDLETRDAVLAILGGDVSEERRLLAIRDDVAQTRVIALAAPLKITEKNETDVEVDFEGSDSVWRSESANATTKSFTSTLDQAMHLVVPGNTRTAPRIILTPTLQRSIFTATVGFRYRRRYVLTNLADEPLFRYPVRISLGDTTPLTTPKAQTSGDDVRVVINGLEVQRTLVTWDTGASYVWFIVEALPAGASMTVEVWYGNPSATNPPVLAYPNLPAFTLASSSNALWAYPIGSAAKGIWFVSDDTTHATVDFTIPGAWRPLLTLDDPAHSDMRSQVLVSPYVSGATHFQARFAAARQPREGTGSIAIGIPLFLTVPAQAILSADGVGVSVPIGITSIRTDFSLDNSSVNFGRVVILGRNSSSSEWGVIFSSATTAASIAVATYTPAVAVKHLALAVWPYNYAFFPDTAPNDLTYVETTATLEINLNSSLISITGGAEEEIYELATELRIGGGQDRTPRYRALLIGNARGEAGAGVSRCAVLMTGQALDIDGHDLTHEVWASDLSAKVESVSAHAIRPIVGFDSDGTTEEGPSNLLLPIAPPRIKVPNGTFDADISSWIAGTTTALVTATRSWDGAIGGDQLGSLKVAITPNTAGAGAQAETVCTRYFSVNGRESIDVAGWCKSSVTTITPRLRINWYDEDQTLLSSSTETDWTPVANTPVRRIFAARVPAGAALYRIVALAYIDGAAATGTVWFDDITTNDVELIVADVAMGTLSVTAELEGRWLG